MNKVAYINLVTPFLPTRHRKKNIKNLIRIVFFSEIIIIIFYLLFLLMICR